MPYSNTKKTVLFVDDEIRVLNSLEASFEDDYNVIVAYSPQKAIEILKERKVHILVSDQRMPEMLGYQLLAQARKIQPSTVRLLMTGYSDKQSILETINQGEVFRFIAKPWNISEFSATLMDASIASEVKHIELLENAQTENNSTEFWQDQISTLDYKPSVLVYRHDAYIETLMRVASEKIDTDIYTSESISDSVKTILENEEISIVFFEMKGLNAEIISTLAMLRRVRPEVVTIIFTKSTDFEVAVKLINHGQAFRYLAEPISIKQLRATLFSALNRHIALTQNKQSAIRYKSDTRNLSLTQRVVNLFARKDKKISQENESALHQNSSV